jgi:hypothetical protein
VETIQWGSSFTSRTVVRGGFQAVSDDDNTDDGWSPADLHRRYQPHDVPFLVDDAGYLGPVLEEDILSVTSHAIEGGKYVVSGPLLKAVYRHRIQLLVTDSIATDSRCVRTGIGTPSNVSLGKQNDERSRLRMVQPCRAGDSPIVARSPRRLPQFATKLTRSLASDNGGSLSVQERECICPLARPEDPLTSISPSNTDPVDWKVLLDGTGVPSHSINDVGFLS